VTLTGNGYTSELQVLGGIATDVTWGAATLTVTIASRVERWSLPWPGGPYGRGAGPKRPLAMKPEWGQR
jgi:hypothetical protein